MTAARRLRIFWPVNRTRARGCSRTPRSSALIASYRIPIRGFSRSFLSPQGDGLRDIERRLEHKPAFRRRGTTSITAVLYRGNAPFLVSLPIATARMLSRAKQVMTPAAVPKLPPKDPSQTAAVQGDRHRERPAGDLA